MSGLRMPFLVLFGCCYGQAEAMTIEEAESQVLSSTNFFGVSFAEYRSRVADAVPFLATNGTMAARQALCVWYVAVAGFSSPTNSVAEHDLWLEEQSTSLSAYSRFLLDPQFTNAWMAAACRMGELRNEAQSFVSLRRNMKERFSENGFAADPDVMRAWLMREQDIVFARQRASDVLIRPVVDVFGSRGIPMLPQGERFAFASNYVSQARFSENESAIVLKGLNK